MIIVLKPEATEEVAQDLLARIESEGCRPLHMPGAERVVLGALGDERVLARLRLESHPLVEEVKPILSPYKLVSRDLRPEDTVVPFGGAGIGSDLFAILAGPCAVENREQIGEAAKHVAAAGAHGLRGGAFKPRTSPYSFQGLGADGLLLLREAADAAGLPCVTEVVDAGDVEAVAEHADAFQIGARNMQNFRLLAAVGEQTKPVLLKRGMSAKLEDLLLAAEYVVAAGNPNVILCERGIRTFETALRNTLDLAAVPYLKARTHLPVLVDPSHGTGLRELVAPLTRAALAVGADGVIVEVHPDPAAALSDGRQSLDCDAFAELVRELEPLAAACGRRLS